jgi:predicted ATPase
MIREFHAQGYGCLVDTRVTLTPLHALIGPNDSGKSTLMRAVTTLCSRFTSRSDAYVDITRFSSGPGGTLELRTDKDLFVRYVRGEVNPSINVGWRDNMVDIVTSPNGSESWRSLLTESNWRVRSVRFDPDQLRAFNPPLAREAPIAFQNNRGLGLASLYDVILGEDAEKYLEIQKRVQTLFPHIARVKLVSAPGGKVFEFELRDGLRLSVEQVSEGLLYYLAYEALQHISPIALLCVEEPENGLHPRRIKEVVDILRRISERGTQVLMATHSPLVMNELDPSEVTILVRPPGEGTRATAMTDTQNFQRRSQVYALGELWVSYADGELESRLTNPSEEPDI